MNPSFRSLSRLTGLSRWLDTGPASAQRPATHELRFDGRPLEERVVPALIMVTNTADAGGGSLRAAIATANTDSVPDTIMFNLTNPGLNSITLTTGILDITNPVTIDAFNFGFGVRVVQATTPATPVRVMSISGAGPTSITGLSLSGGSSVAGGGILFGGTGTLALVNTTVSGNTATSSGGGLYASAGTGAITITNSRFTNNNAASQGGAIRTNSTAPITISGSTISNNTARTGGGIYESTSGVLSVSNSTVSGNTATSNGGGIYFFFNGTLTVTDSTMSTNTAGDISTFGYGGGAVYFYGTGAVNITRSVFAGNLSLAGDRGAATQGGGALLLLNRGGATTNVTNSTFDTNESLTDGSAISAEGILNLSSTTVSGGFVGNVGGVSLSSGTLNLRNTIVAGTTKSGLLVPDIALGSTAAIGTVTTSLVQTLGTVPIAAAGNKLNVDPLLSTVGNYGGSRQSVALLPGSVAIDAGTAGGTTPATDSRGFSRVGNTDIGSFESGGFTIAPAPLGSGSGQSTRVGTGFGLPLAVKVTAVRASEPVVGGKVTFTAPAAGASAVIVPNQFLIGTTGIASTTGVLANTTLGSYTVTATVPGVVGSVAFTLTNTANIPPVIAVAAFASPTVVPGTASTTMLSATATDADDPATSLIYIWSLVSGPAPVSFTPNGTNAASSSKATFTAPGTYVLRVTVTDPVGAAVTSDVTVTRLVPTLPPASTRTAIADISNVRVFDTDGNQLFLLNPFPGFGRAVSVAVGDVDGDRIDDIVVAATAGGAPHVKVYSGATGAQIASFFAFVPTFTGGVFVAVGDVNGDNLADIVVGAGAGGGPHVKVIDAARLGQIDANGVIGDSALLASYLAYNPTFVGGVRVAAGDVNGDGKADIITASGLGSRGHIKVVDATKLGAAGTDASLLASFFAYGATFTGGAFVGSGVFGTGISASIVIGAGAGGGAHLKVVDGAGFNQRLADGSLADSAYTVSQIVEDPAAFSNGIRVGSTTVGGVRRIVVGSGPGSRSPLKLFSATGAAVANPFRVEPEWNADGIFVG